MRPRPRLRRRPPWWPEDQAWPPRGRAYGPPWVRGRFLRRAAALFFAMVILTGAGLVLAGWLAAAVLGLVPVPPPIRLAAAAALLLALLGVLAAMRGFRRFASPFGDLVEAARKVEAGDYGARVPERGWGEIRSLVRAFNAMSARLEATDRRRRSFLADVSHELKTPLSVIRGQAEAIADGVYPGDAAHVAPILDATAGLEVLVEDLRTLALSETGSLALAREPVEVAALVEEVLAGVRAQAEAAGVLVAADVAPDVGAVDGDPARLRAVLANLLANSLHHSRAGGRITVTARRESGAVSLRVRDSGGGIPADLLPHVFDRFVKGPESRGSGLGLAIARQLVEAHGGSIAIESREGEGTEVLITLPAG